MYLVQNACQSLAITLLLQLYISSDNSILFAHTVADNGNFGLNKCQVIQFNWL